MSGDEREPRSPRGSLITGRGACYATKRVMVDRAPVGHFWRDDPDEDTSGWWFAAGDESQEYVDDADNWDVYDIDSVAQVDPSIVPYLDHPSGVDYGREPDGTITPLHRGLDERTFTRALPDTEGRMELDEVLELELPGRFRRRFERDSLVVWRKGTTIWFTVHTSNVVGAAERMFGALPPRARDSIDERVGGLRRAAYRANDATRGTQASFNGLVHVADRLVVLHARFDAEADAALVLALWRSVRLRVS